MSDTWYKRDPKAFLDGVQGMGPELIGAYSVILEIIYARGGEMPRDDRHLSGVLGCSLRKSRALTEQLISLGKIRIVGGNVVNDRASLELETRRKQRETEPKSARKVSENRPASNENKALVSQNRREENITPLSPQGGMRSHRVVGVSEQVQRLVRAMK